MSHTDIIWIVVTASFASTFGVYVCIRKTIQYTRPPVNTLQRRGDIELMDYIEPTRPEQVYNYPDLLDQQPIPWYIYERTPFYYTGPPPLYQSTDRININSCLENENIFNLYFIFLIIICFIIIILKMKSIYILSILIPFSLFEIDFRDSFDWKKASYRVNPIISYLKLQNLTEDIIKLLHSLNDVENYSMSLSFISSYSKWKDNKDKINPLFIDDAIIVNKESDPILISEFILKRLDDKNLFITNWLFNDSLINSLDVVILTVSIPIKVNI